MLSLVLCYSSGALTILLIEAVLVFYAFRRLSRGQKSVSTVKNEAGVGPELLPDHSIDSLRNKKEGENHPHQSASGQTGRNSSDLYSLTEGVIWILEPEKVSKVSPLQSKSKVPKEPKRKTEIFEVLPARRFARIEGQVLVLRDVDGGESLVHLDGCTVAAVSASSLSTRKWAKKYPIRVENKKSTIYNGRKVCYIYVETSWEKESWCRALRIASCADKEKLKWYMKVSHDFHQFVTSLNGQYPFFSKPFMGFSEPAGKSQKIISSSKVRLFLKRLAKKSSKAGPENRVYATNEERRNSNKAGSGRDISSQSIVYNAYPTGKHPVNPTQGDSTSSLGSDTGTDGQISESGILEVDPGQSGAEGYHEKPGVDQGTLSWNLLFSRLFFDASKSQELVNFMQSRIQIALSNLRTPSYVGGITCTDLDIGSLPPYIHNIWVLPMDMNDVWAVDVDIEYSGGAVLNIETRLEVGSPDFQRGIGGTSSEQNSLADTDIYLCGLEQLGLSQDAPASLMKGNEEDKKDEIRSDRSWKMNYVSKWKSRLSSLADQVSQMPLSLAIKIVSLRGTLRIYIKPPPSDQIWFSFTTMPEIEWDLQSHVGEHKITNGQIALLISNRIKAALKDSIVLPNCECIHVPWMLAEKDNWVPRDVAPFIWAQQEASNSTGSDTADRRAERTKSRPESGRSKEGSVRPKVDAETSDAASLDCRLGKAKSTQEFDKGGKEGSVKNYDIAVSDSESLGISSHPSDHEDTSLDASPSESTGAAVLRYKQLVDVDISSELKIPLMKREESPDNSSTCSSKMDVSGNFGDAQTKDSSVTDSDKPKKYGKRAKVMDIRKKMGEKFEEKRRHIEEKGRLMVEKMRGNETSNQSHLF